MNKSPSIFWPLQLLVTVIGLWLGYQLVMLNSQRLKTEQVYVQLYPQYQSAVGVQQKLTALAKDLLQASVQDAGAAQIVKEFQISEAKKAEQK